MPTIFEPADDAYEPEWRLFFEANTPQGVHIVVSGHVKTWEWDTFEGTTFMHGMIHGDEDDKFTTYNVRLIVGPWMRDVGAVVPVVTLHGYENTDSDDDDQQGWEISGLSWDTVGGEDAHSEEERIRLKFRARIKGESSYIMSVSYHLTARARALGFEGANSPPSHGKNFPGS